MGAREEPPWGFADDDDDDDLGYCPEMCPPAETQLRLENDLVHRLEHAPGFRPHPRGVNARSLRLVKKFSRSAAGSEMAAGETRSPALCLRTARYLIRRFVAAADFGRSEYDFVFDRLRAVRQDLVAGGGDGEGDDGGAEAAAVLAICVRFHLYAGYRFCESSDFDPATNFRHCLDCLKAQIALRQEARSRLRNRNDDDDDPDLGFFSSEDEEMACAYLVLNLGSAESIKWALALDKKVRSLPSVRSCLECNFCFLERNHARMFRAMLVGAVPVTALLAFHWKLPTVISEVLSVMSAAYASKVLTYPTADFSRLFCLGQKQDSVLDLFSRSGVETREDGSRIAFKKKSFVDVKIPHFRTDFMDGVLSGVRDVGGLILYGNRKTEEA